MSRYAKAIERTGIALGSCAPGADAALQVLPLTFDPDPLVRRVAAKALCPCHVRANVPEVWDRLLDMTNDTDPGVRLDVVHALGDGSPRDRAPDIVGALEGLHNDPRSEGA